MKLTPTTPWAAALCASAVLAASLVLGGCSRAAEGTAEPGDAGPAADARIPVEVLALAPKPFDERFAASGVIEAEEEVTISSEIAGRIVTLSREIGQPVRAGEMLVRLDDRAQRATVAKLRAEVERAQTQLEWAKRDLERQVELFETQVTAERARDDAQRMVDTSEDDLAARWADLEAAKVELDRTSIRSPLSGKVARRHVAPGEYVTPGTQLFDVVSDGAVEFVFSVSETDVIGMTTGQSIDLAIDAYPGQSFTGYVAAISPAGSVGTRTFRVELKVASKATRPLLPGMAGRANVVRRSHEAIFLIPESAILRDGANGYVWVAQGETASRRDVQILSQTGTLAVVASDFDAADGCIILGQAAVSDGAAVRVRRVHDQPPASVFD